MNALAPRIRTALNVHSDESRMAALVIGVMLLTSAGFTLGSKGVETLFYTRYGVEYLPYMFLLSGVLSLLISLGITAMLGRFRREHLYIIIPVGVAIATVLAWLALYSTWKMVYPILWLGKEVINSLVTLVVWGIASSVCDTRQSKRLFPLFNAGRILGAVIGGFGTGLLVDYIGTQNLLLVWAGMLLLAFVLTRALLLGRVPAGPARKTRRKHAQHSMLQEMQEGFQFVRGSSLLIWVSVASILFSILYRCIELPFAQSATVQFMGDEKSLAGFLGLFDGLSTAGAFLASTFLANRLYARFGIMNAILALPVIYLLGFSGVALFNAFASIIIFRYVQVLWLSGLADSAWQAMFNATPPARVDQIRAFMNIPEQAGTFLAGLVTLVFAAHQLAVVGLVAAAAATFVIWRAAGAYNFALVDSLRKGRPTIFGANSRPDATALRAALDGMNHPDVVVRRVSTEIVSLHSTVAEPLVRALEDNDIEVRLSSLRGLSRLQASSALLEVAPILSDPQPAARAQAVDTLRALTPHPRGLGIFLEKMLDDSEPRAQVRAMVALLTTNPEHPCRIQLRKMAVFGNVDERVLALNALAEIGDPEALGFFTNELRDPASPLPVRCAAATALGTCGQPAIPVLLEALSSEEIPLRSSAAAGLGKIGDESLSGVVNALEYSASEDGALLALGQLSAWKEAGRVRAYVRKRIDSATHFERLRLTFDQNADARIQLLADSLQSRARRDGILALRALSLLDERETVSVAIESLKGGQQISDALETLESVREAALIRPLLQIWEPSQDTSPEMDTAGAIEELLNEKDEWLRACAEFAKEKPMDAPTTLSMMERVLLLRRVPLLAALSPADLQRVAALATEEDFVDGDIICEQGEAGNEMFVIVFGTVKVIVSSEGQPDKEIARRAAGDVVGEMSLISGDLRIASVIAIGDVRALCLDRLSFEGLLRERPEVSLAIMRELCNRLKELTH